MASKKGLFRCFTAKEPIRESLKPRSPLKGQRRPRTDKVGVLGPNGDSSQFPPLQDFTQTEVELSFREGVFEPPSREELERKAADYSGDYKHAVSKITSGL